MNEPEIVGSFGQPAGDRLVMFDNMCNEASEITKMPVAVCKKLYEDGWVLSIEPDGTFVWEEPQTIVYSNDE